MSICGIYQIKNLVSGKVYIGQSIDIRKRFREHKHYLRNNTHRNIYLQRAWSKYGSANFTFNILEICLESELNDKEIFFIIEHRKMTEVYNLCDGGYGIRGYTHTEETRKKMKEISKLKHPTGMLGKRHSEETKKKLSNINKGKKLPEEVVRKMIEFRIGRKHSEETRRKISQSHIGNTNSKGIKRSEDEKRRISERQRGQNSSSAKLRDEQVYRIKELLSEGKRNKLIAIMFNASPSVICDIKHGRTWSHIVLGK